MWILQAFGSLKKGDVLCSRHFKKTDFDRSTLNTKLKAGAIPSIFECPYHLQEKREKLHCRKNFLLKTLPITHHGRQLVGASCIEEFEPQFIFEHSYSVMDSPKKLKHKLDRVIIELENTKESLRNVLAREKHFQKSLRKTIMELKDESLISQETANSLGAFCWECYHESTAGGCSLWSHFLYASSAVDMTVLLRRFSHTATQAGLHRQHYGSQKRVKDVQKAGVVMLLCDLWQLHFYRPKPVLGHYSKGVKSHKSKELYQVGHTKFWQLERTTHVHLYMLCSSLWF